GAFLRGTPLPAWPWHELPGYQFAADTVRAALAEPLNSLLWQRGSQLGFHLVNLLMTSAAILLVALLADAEGRDAALRRPAAALLPLQPKLVAHSQATPRDVVALLVWTLAIFLLARAAQRSRWRDFFLLGAAIGLAVASHVTAVLLVPIAAA